MSNFTRPFLFIGPTYKLLGSSLKCTSATTYTFQCDGIGFTVDNVEECQEKCNNNEFPSKACNKGQKCMYAHYIDMDHIKFCHLADNTCEKETGPTYYSLYMKGMEVRIHGVT